MKLIKEVLADLQAMDQSPDNMRKFGLVSAMILAAAGGLVLFKNRAAAEMFTSGVWIFWGIAGALFVMSICIPKFLKPINSVMVVVALIIGWFVTRIVLIFMFYFVFFPVGLMLKMAGKDSLRRKIDKEAESYWIDRSDEVFDPARCRRLF